MNIICPTCKRTNPPNARFCACCGRALRRQGGGRIAVGAFPALVVILGIVLWSGGLRGCPGGGLVSKARDALRSRTSSHLVKRHFHLSPAKADAMFKLLAPSDIKVIVGRHNRGVNITGTPREAEILEEFVELLVRHEGSSKRELQQSIERLRSTWTKRQTYKLPRDKARSLFHVLAFDDVPVYVHGYPSRVIVDATERDQQTVAGVVEILHGHRLR